MNSRAVQALKSLLLVLAAVAGALVVARPRQSQREPALEPWHTFVPDELRAPALDQANWSQYVGAEKRVFGSVRENVTQRLPAEDRVPLNRYSEGSPIYPGPFRSTRPHAEPVEP